MADEKYYIQKNTVYLDGEIIQEFETKQEAIELAEQLNQGEKQPHEIKEKSEEQNCRFHIKKKKGLLTKSNQIYDGEEYLFTMKNSKDAEIVCDYLNFFYGKLHDYITKIKKQNAEYLILIEKLSQVNDNPENREELLTLVEAFKELHDLKK